MDSYSISPSIIYEAPLSSKSLVGLDIGVVGSLAALADEPDPRWAEWIQAPVLPQHSNDFIEHGKSQDLGKYENREMNYFYSTGDGAEVNHTTETSLTPSNLHDHEFHAQHHSLPYNLPSTSANSYISNFPQHNPHFQSHASAAPELESTSPREAAIHLLRLALPSNKSASTSPDVASSTLAQYDDEDSSCDEDAEGELELDLLEVIDAQSSNTSIRSDDEFHHQQHSLQGKDSATTRTWNYGENRAIQIQVPTSCGGTSSVASSRVRHQHRPARIQRASSNRSGSISRHPSEEKYGRNEVEEGTTGGRRMSMRGRNSTGNGPNGGRKIKVEGYYREFERDDTDDEAEMSNEDVKEIEPRGSRKFARTPPKSTKRSLSQPPSPNTKPDVKRARLSRNSSAKVPQAARRSRASTSNLNSGSSRSRQASKTFVATLTIPQRSFLPEVEVLGNLFPRYYRAFYLSSAISPQSIIHRLAPLSAALGPNHSESTISSSASSPSESFTSIGSTTTNPTTVNSSCSSPSTSHNKSRAINLHPVVFMTPPTGSIWNNKSTQVTNLYTPRFIRGKGDAKEGLCPICCESEERGGEGEMRWLKVR